MTTKRNQLQKIIHDAIIRAVCEYSSHYVSPMEMPDTRLIEDIAKTVTKSFVKTKDFLKATGE